MTIFQSNSDKKTYTIEHLVLDIKFANCNENAGLFIRPYLRKGETFHLKSKDVAFCKTFVVNNFTAISYT